MIFGDYDSKIALEGAVVIPRRLRDIKTTILN